MIDQNFIINTDRLRKSQELKVKVDFEASSDFLLTESKDLRFEEKVSVSGEIYIVDEELILHLNMVVPAVLVCNICNGDAHTEIHVNDVYHVVDLKEVRSPLFDYSSVIREEILLEIPRFVECNEGSCPDRELIKPYLVENN